MVPLACFEVAGLALGFSYPSQRSLLALEITMAATPEPEQPPSPKAPRACYQVSIKGIGQFSHGLGEVQATASLSGERIHHGLTTTCQRMEMSSLRPWGGSREQLLSLVASARCSDATLIPDEPCFPLEPTLLG